ncbi:MAG: hypothetical protein WDN10_02270 [bacterium]
MNELLIGNQTFISSKRASEITGYAKDYVGQLAREGRVTATLVGRSWYVLESAIREHRFGKQAEVSSGAQGPKEEQSGLEKAASPAWGSPRYSSEEVPSIFEVPTESPGVNLLSSEESEQTEVREIPAAETQSALQDIQSAWQDWFINRVGPQESQNVPISEPETFEEGPVAAPEPIEEATSITLHISRNEEQISSGNDFEPVDTYIVSETRHELAPAKRKEVKKGHYVLSSLMLTAAGIAVLIAIIGTGKLDFIAANDGLQANLIQFLNGAEQYEKTNK